MQNLIKMYAGEKRKIRLFVHSRKKPEDTFIIRNAKAEIYLYGDLMQTIECEIDEHDLIFFIRHRRKWKLQK